MKRGQATIFIIIGGIVLFVVITTFIIFNKYTTSDEIAEGIVYPLEAEEYYYQVEECIVSSSEISLSNLKMGGGYYQTPEPYFDATFLKVPYVLYEGIQYPITIETVEAEFEKYLKLEIFSCIEDLDLTFNTEDLELDSKLNEDYIEVSVVLPTTVTMVNNTYSFEDYYVEVDTGLYEILNLQQQILDLHTTEGMPLSEILYLFEGSDLELDMNMDEEDVLYSINGFQFMVGYEWLE